MSRNKIPSFLVIGVQKAATSWLYYCLKEHPEIYLPSHKREGDYLGGEKYQQKGWDWWISRFGGVEQGQLIGDVSVDYVYSKKTPKMVKEKLGNVKLVVSLRNPIDRAISAYYWNLRKGKIPNRPLNAGLKKVLKVTKDPKRADFDLNTEEIYKNIIKRGFYDEQISRYLEFFDIENFLFLSFNKIQKQPMQQIRLLYSFLGVNNDYKPRALNRRPKKNSYLSPLIALERAGRGSRLISTLSNMLHNLAYILGIAKERPQLDKEVSEEITDVYKDHNQNLLKILLSYKEISSGSLHTQINWAKEVLSWNTLNLNGEDKKT